MNRLPYLIILCSPFLGFSYERDEYAKTERLFADLDQIEKKGKQAKRLLPSHYNNWGTLGYFAVPSANMESEGMCALSATFQDRMRIYTATLQWLSRLEVRGHYLTLPDCFSASAGCNTQQKGDTRRLASFKWALLGEEDDLSALPNISLGAEGIVGDRGYSTWYGVASGEIAPAHLEWSLGWGWGRIAGPFAALRWSPWSPNTLFDSTLSLLYEYRNRDNMPRCPHFSGRQRHLWNAGISLQSWDIVSLDLYGDQDHNFRAHAAIQYNLGTAEGVFPKFLDPPLCSSTLNREPLGAKRRGALFAQECAEALEKQGLDLMRVSRYRNTVSLHVSNPTYRQERVLRKRMIETVAPLCPEGIEGVKLVLESSGIPLQQYTLPTKLFREETIPSVLQETCIPMEEITFFPSSETLSLYVKNKPLLLYTIQPIFSSYFASSSGDLKYAIGIRTTLDGDFRSFYYACAVSYTIQSSPSEIDSLDLANPSQLVHVRSDQILYRRSHSLHLDQGFLQKNWNLGKGCFMRCSAGYFEVAYAGVAAEALFYPVDGNFSLGIEAALLRKRSYHGLGLTKQIRKFQDCTLVYVPYYGLQYFGNIHYKIPEQQMRVGCKVGQFLAKDIGARFEVDKTFPSGWNLSFWTTFTNGKDRANGRRYFDKGIAFSLPMDLFLNKSSRKKLGYSFPERIRDVGAIAATGMPLYPTIYEERLGCLLAN